MRNNLIWKQYSSLFWKSFFFILIIYLLHKIFLEPKGISFLDSPETLLFMIINSIILFVIELKKKTLIKVIVSESEINILNFSILTGKKTNVIKIKDLVSLYSESLNYITLEYNCVMGKNFRGNRWKSKVKVKYKIIAEPWEDIYVELRKLKSVMS